MIIFFRSLFVWVFGILLTGFLGMLAIGFSLFRAQNKAHSVAVLWGRISAFISGIEIEVTGLERLHRDGPVVIVSNHQSMFDILVFYSVLDIQFRWMAKASLFKIPIFGKGMKGAGYVPVERDDPKKAKESLFVAAEMIRGGTSVILFPEGTRGKANGEMLPFKKGGFLLAKKAGTTMQPITIWGANHAVPIQKKHWIQRIYPTLVQVYIHEPIPAEEVKKLSSEELSERVRLTLETVVPKLKLRQEVEVSLKW
jgi:1-acyl-sn-glycerol-3-phosphate acyltransferase